MSALRCDSPVQYIKGVGPRRAELFAELGLRTVGDLLEYFPFRHELDQGDVAIEDVRPGSRATVRGEVVQVGGRRPSLRVTLDDGTAQCNLRWFNQFYGVKGLYRGAIVIATGDVQLFDGRPELIQPTIQVISPDAVAPPLRDNSRRAGVYRGSGDLKSPIIARAVRTVLAENPLPVEEPLPATLLRKHRLPGRAHAIRAMHTPKSDEDLERARRRLVYEEFLLMELAMALRRHKARALARGQKLHVTQKIDKHIRARFPFHLTGSQNDVIREIARDLSSGQPMTRLLQGDVGSGKTVVALYACLVAVANRRQAAIMAPTEILAQQHYANIQQYLADSRVRHVLLTGGLSRGQRTAALAAIERGEIDLVVGTQALIQKDVAFNQLAVVVVDEQHKFGVVQRHTFRTKGPMPHYLVMTATPIPRTLSMTVFGDLDVSIIKHAPPGRGRITTRIVTAHQWDVVMQYVRGRLEKGEQAYVVCPVIGEQADDGTPGSSDAADVEAAAETNAPRGAGRDQGRKRVGAAHVAARAQVKKQGALARELLSVVQTHGALVNGPWSGLDVGLLHGGLPSAEKRAIIEAFIARRLHALVSTTVVEVGVDVPSATIMVVEHAERYGLSQLHQLRGRVGRGHQNSLCVLIARGRGEKSAERLAVLAETTDGFRIAEADLRQRGPGQLFGTRQHGLPELRIGNLVDDFELLELARQDAFALVAADPRLEKPEHEPLLPALRKMFGDKLSLIDAA